MAGLGIGGGAVGVGGLPGRVTRSPCSSRRPLRVRRAPGTCSSPRAQAALARLGLLEEVAARSWPIRSFHAGKGQSSALVTLRYDRRLAEAFALGVERGVLFDVLVRAAKEAGVRVEPGTRVTGVSELRDVVEPRPTPARSAPSTSWSSPTAPARASAP